MNYFVFTLKSRKLYKEINGASSWVTNQVILGAHTKVTGKLVFLLRSRNYEIESRLGFPGRKANIFSMQVSSRARWVHSLFLGAVREKIVSQKSLMDSWFYSWWLRIACSVYAKRYKNLSIYSSVILGIPVFWVTPYTNPSWCRFFFISGQCYGYPLIPYRDTNIPCYLGCCFEVLSFAAYPGYPLVPYRETNIPCYLGCCFEVLSFAAYPG